MRSWRRCRNSNIVFFVRVDDERDSATWGGVRGRGRPPHLALGSFGHGCSLSNIGRDGTLPLALRAVVCSALRQDNAPDGRATAGAGLPFPAVDTVLQLKIALAAIGVYII